MNVVNNLRLLGSNINMQMVNQLSHTVFTELQWAWAGVTYTILLLLYKTKNNGNKVTYFTFHQISQITEVDLERSLLFFFLK